MARYSAIALATILCACGSLSETTHDGARGLLPVNSPQPQPASLSAGNMSDDSGPRSTVPMIEDAQKESTLDAVARALHIYWFFGSR